MAYKDKEKPSASEKLEACGGLLVSAASPRQGFRPGKGIRLGGVLGHCCGPQQAGSLSLVPASSSLL